jgi:response regulator RpfG family c-di-GMP phosphodiesterase
MLSAPLELERFPMTVARLNFLVIDHHKDSRFLLVTCLQRKFPGAAIIEAEDGEIAVEIARRRDLAAIVTHRTREYFGTELVGKLREMNPEVAIVMVSGIERTGPALAAGADRFLLYDEWLRIGSIVKEVLDKGGPSRTVEIKITPVPGGEPV